MQRDAVKRGKNERAAKRPRPGKRPRQDAAGPSQAAARTATKLRPEFSHTHHAKSDVEVEEPGAPRGWLAKRAMAEAFDVTEQHFDRSLRPLIPDGAVKTIDRRIFFHARSLIDAWSAAQAKPGRPDLPADPLLGLGDFDEDTLAEYRRVKTAQERITLAEMEGRVVPRDELDPALAKLAGIIRSTGESLQRQYGPEIAAAFNEMIDEWERATATMFATPSIPSSVVNGQSSVVSCDPK